MPEPKPAPVRRVLDRARGAWGRASFDSRALGVSALALLAAAAIAVPVRPGPWVLVAVFAPLFAALYVALLRRLRFDGGTIAILLAAYGLYLGYLSYTGHGDRNYDGPEQLEYIRYVVEKRALPRAAECFVCHHPPAYYVLAALPYTFFEKTRLASPVLGVQLFSLALFLGFSAASVSLVRRFTQDAWRVRLATALIAFWPYSFHNSVRVHNDSLVSTLMVVALLFTVRWHQDDRPRDLYVASAAAALALLTKSSAYVVVATLLVVIGWRFFARPGRLRQLRRVAVVLAVLVAAMFLNTLRKGETRPEASSTRGAQQSSLVDRRGAVCQKLLGSACDISPATWVGNGPFNYIWFDVRSFLSEPYLLSDRDETGRQFFWNHLAQSSLFGTHNKVADRETAYELNAGVAVVMHALSLGMMALLGLTFLQLDRERLKRIGVPLVAIGFFIAFAMGFRALVPAPHHSDFRHIFPVMPLVSLGYASAIGFQARRRSVLQPIGLALSMSFLALSIFYFWPKQAWATRVSARTVRVELADYAKPVPAGTPWDRRENLLIEPNHTIELSVSPHRVVSGIDVSLDHNDVYEVRLVHAGGSRRFRLGPKVRKKGGLSRYEEAISPPLEGVTRVTLRAIRGDGAYAMGHLVLQSP